MDFNLRNNLKSKPTQLTVCVKDLYRPLPSHSTTSLALRNQQQKFRLLKFRHCLKATPSPKNFRNSSNFQSLKKSENLLIKMIPNNLTVKLGNKVEIPNSPSPQQIRRPSTGFGGKRFFTPIKHETINFFNITSSLRTNKIKMNTYFAPRKNIIITKNNKKCIKKNRPSPKFEYLTGWENS